MYTLKQVKHCIKQESWTSSSKINSYLDDLTKQQSVFLDKIQGNPSDVNLNFALKEVNRKISQISNIMASWIIQRAKVKWLRQGEDDLKFLYAKIKSRQSNSRTIVNFLASNTISDREDVIKGIIQHYQTLFNPPPPTFLNIHNFPIRISVLDSCLEALSLPVSDMEIGKTVFKGKSNSTPGPDEFNSHFYKAGWNIMGPMICIAVKSFFSKGYLPPGIKATALALIPKHNKAEHLSDFLPIALCNSLYKIIAKVISNRMKHILPLII